jgi:hypothetical protein
MTKYILNYVEDPLHHIHGGFIPEHTRSGLENYLFKGWEPGSFMMAVLTGNLFDAAFRADPINKKELAGIAIWIMHNAPPLSFGTELRVERWCVDHKRCRTIWAEEVQKKFVWETLSSH